MATTDPSERRFPRAVVALLVIAGGGGMLALALVGGGSSGAARVEPAPQPEASAPDAGASEPARAESAAATAHAAAPAFTEIFVAKTGDEIGGASDPEAAGRLGAGRAAALRGRVTDEKATPVQNARVRFIAGLNAGEPYGSAFTDLDGRYEMQGIYHGAAIVEFETPKQQRARRDVVLRKNRVTILDQAFLAVGDVAGSLIDSVGKPVVGARVEIDGAAVETDRDGAFFHTVVSPGDVIAYLSAPVFESRRLTMTLRPGQHLVFDQVRLPLRRGESLTVAIEPLPPATRPWAALLLPNDPPTDRSFPFERMSVAQPGAGEDTARFDGLPVGESFQVRVFSEFGVCDPPMRPVMLKGGDTNLSRATFSLVWKSPVSGLVTVNGQPLPGTPVRLESEDLAESTESLLREVGGLDRTPVPVLPCVRKTSETGFDGRFRIESADVQRPALLVIDAPRFRRVVKRLPVGTADFGTIELQPRGDEAPGSLTIEFARPAARRARVTVGGKPRADESVAEGAGVRLGDLAPGVYGVVVREEGKEVLRKEGLVVHGETKLSAP